MHDREASDDGAVEALGHAWLRFARYLVAYRGNLSRSEAARRSGLPEALWEQVESVEPSEPVTELLPAALVAAMCVSVGADVGTGLHLAGHRPELYPHLVERPPVHAGGDQGSEAPLPCIATPHIVTEMLAVESAEANRRIAEVYRHLARSNGLMADHLVEAPPDEREDYWAGYAAAVRGIAEQQARAADQAYSRSHADGR